jgi:hypothetical protein
MDFVVARGFRVPFPSLFDHSVFRIGAAPTLISDGEVLFATSHAPVRSGDLTLAFDGHAFDHDLFLHHASARPEDVLRLRDRVLANLGGVFCLVSAAGEDGAVRALGIVTDPLGMYPVYVHRGAGGSFVVSNDAHLVAAVLRANGAAPRRTLLPCLFGLAFNGPTGEPFLYEQVTVLPSGHRLSVRGGRLAQDGPPPFRYDRSGTAYEACLDAACAQMQGAARLLFEAHSDAHVALDVTGGADSRAILAVILSLGLERRVGVRNFMALPHPDAHVAALLAERYGLPVGEGVLAHAGGIFESYFAAASVDAYVHGGARDNVAAQNATAFVGDLVSLTGFFGEIAGKWVPWVAKSPKVARMSPAERTEALLARRRRIGQLDFFTDAGLEIVREGITAHYRAIVDAGAEPQHVEAESYLASRCRTHFGLMSAGGNRRRIQPDLLGNPWMVRARRSLDAALAADNKVVFDIVRRLGGAELAFAPMADKSWERSVVDAADLPAYERMDVVTRKTPFGGRRRERLMRFRMLPGDTVPPIKVPLIAVGPPAREIIFPGDRTRRFAAPLVRWALDNGGREAIGDWLDVDAIVRRCEDGAWRPDTIVRAGFFEKLLCGLLWMIGEETPSRIDRAVGMADLPPVPGGGSVAAAGGNPATRARTSDDRTIARTLLRAVPYGKLMGPSEAGAEPSAVPVATLPDGTPLLLCPDPRAAPDGGEWSLRLVAGPNGGQLFAGFSLRLMGMLHPVDASDAAMAKRRFRARHGAAGDPEATGLARLVVTRGRLTAPDGRAVVFSAPDLATDVSAAAALLAIEERALARLEREARDMLPGLASRFGGGRRGIWVPTGVDPDGLDLAADGGHRSCRVPFPAPVHDGPSLQATIIGLVLDDRPAPAPAPGPESAGAHP